MSRLRFTCDHQWLRKEDDSSLTLGITDYAQEQLGDIVYIELPEIGRRFQLGDDLAVIESVKASGEIRMPVAGSIRSINERLADEPEIVNSEPYEAGWLLCLEADEVSSIDSLMDDEAYQTYIDDL